VWRKPNDTDFFKTQPQCVAWQCMAGNQTTPEFWRLRETEHRCAFQLNGFWSWHAAAISLVFRAWFLFFLILLSIDLCLLLRVSICCSLTGLRFSARHFRCFDLCLAAVRAAVSFASVCGPVRLQSFGLVLTFPLRHFCCWIFFWLWLREAVTESCSFGFWSADQAFGLILDFAARWAEQAASALWFLSPSVNLASLDCVRFGAGGIRCYFWAIGLKSLSLLSSNCSHVVIS
jgi:hypothetical protein